MVIVNEAQQAPTGAAALEVLQAMTAARWPTFWLPQAERTITRGAWQVVKGDVSAAEAFGVTFGRIVVETHPYTAERCATVELISVHNIAVDLAGDYVSAEDEERPYYVETLDISTCDSALDCDVYAATMRSHVAIRNADATADELLIAAALDKADVLGMNETYRGTYATLADAMSAYDIPAEALA